MACLGHGCLAGSSGGSLLFHQLNSSSIIKTVAWVNSRYGHDGG
jgi:hypothetical protein